MKITEIRVREMGPSTELEASMDNYRLWYRVPSEYNIAITGDPFLAAGFFPSMVTGETLEIEKGVSVSSKLIRGAYQLQEIFSCWNPALKKFKISATEEIHNNINSGSASFFSGGIDGLYSLKKHQDELTHLVYINGFDFEMSPETFEASVRRNRRAAASFNKILIPVETNNFSFMKHHRIDRLLNYGSCLASVALLLGFPRTYIPAGHTFNELIPEGSHPLTDPLWSAEGMKIFHDGAETSRVEKTIQLIEDNTFKEHLNKLIVCWKEPNSNCGECGKCVRTMLTFKLLNFEPLAFPKELSLGDVKRISFKALAYRVHFDDLLKIAIERDERKIARALKWAIKKNLLKLSIKEFDNRYLGDVLKRSYDLVRGKKYQPEPNLIKLK